MAPAKRSSGDSDASLPPRKRKIPSRYVQLDNSSETSDNEVEVINTPPSSLPPSLSPANSTTAPVDATEDIAPWFDIKVTKPLGQASVCKICAAKYADPGQRLRKPTRLQYEYKATTSTTGLRGHLATWHRSDYVKHCSSNNLRIGYKPLRDELTQPTASIESFLVNNPHQPFSVTAVKNALLRWIVADDQSLNVVDCTEFRQLLLACNENLKESDLPHRTQVRDLVFRLLAVEFEELRKRMKNNSQGKISFTADLWTNQNLAPFMAVTAHWIEHTTGGRLHLRADLIAFRPFAERHTGKNIAAAMVDILRRADVLDRVGWFTLNNASNNDTFMAEFSRLLSEEYQPYDDKQGRIRCFPHIVHLAVMDMIRACTDLAAAEDGAADFQVHARRAAAPITPLQAALECDVIAMARTLIRKIRSSSLRREKFNSMQLAEMDISSPKQLLRDCPTRWSSLFLMIDRFIELRPAVDAFVRHPSNTDIEAYAFTAAEWDGLSLIRDLLKIPHSVQQLMSGEKTPLMAHVVPAYEMLMSRLHDFKNEHPETAQVVTPGLEKLRLYYDKTDLTKAYVISQVINPAFKMHHAQTRWSTQFQRTARQWVKSELAKYRNEAPASQFTTMPQVPQSSAMSAWDILGGATTTSATDPSLDEEMSDYLSAPLSTRNVDLVQFWAENQSRFPTFFRAAMDYLPIQASAVPCERVFSSGKETDTKRRNRLAPELMEALQLLKFLLKKQMLDFTAGLRDDDDEADGQSENQDVLLTLLQGLEKGGVEDILSAMSS